MGILKRFTGKHMSETAIPAAASGPVQRNLPLEYVRDKTGLDIAAYRNIARMVNAHSYAGAQEFAQLLGAEPTDQLVHYFHDMLTALCILPLMPNLSADNDTASAIVDGIHFEFYGDASPKVVRSFMDMWEDKPTCFFRTFVGPVSGPDPMHSAQFAAYCIDAEQFLGAIEALRLGKHLMLIVKEKAANVSTFANIMLKKGI